MDPRVEKIQRLLRENLHKEVSLSELAQSVNLSVWRLSHIFNSEVGMGPIKYLRHLRMDRARELLETSYLSIKEIGYHVGLNDESHFARDFKKAYGVPPKVYRRQFKSAGANSSANRKSLGSEVHQGVAKAAKGCALISVNILSYLISKVGIVA